MPRSIVNLDVFLELAPERVPTHAAYYRGRTEYVEWMTGKRADMPNPYGLTEELTRAWMSGIADERAELEDIFIPQWKGRSKC